MKKKKLKCYIYIRVSTSRQVEGYSLEAQRERLTKCADFQDIEIKEDENGWSYAVINIIKGLYPDAEK